MDTRLEYRLVPRRVSAGCRGRRMRRNRQARAPCRVHRLRGSSSASTTRRPRRPRRSASAILVGRVFVARRAPRRPSHRDRRRRDSPGRAARADATGTRGRQARPLPEAFRARRRGCPRPRGRRSGAGSARRQPERALGAGVADRDVARAWRDRRRCAVTHLYEHDFGWTVGDWPDELEHFADLRLLRPLDRHLPLLARGKLVARGDRLPGPRSRRRAQAHWGAWIRTSTTMVDIVRR